ncbi:hypothetical protein J437_LFUL007606, partial [Ladona fulva]
MGTKGKGMAIETMASPIGRRVLPRIDPELIKKVERAMMVKENKGKRTKVKKELPEEKDEFDAMADGKTPTLAQRVGNSPDAVENRLKAKKALKQTKLKFKAKGSDESSSGEEEAIPREVPKRAA